jgi:putative transposase
MSTQQRVELARTRCASDRPVKKSQVARVLGVARRSLSVQTKRPQRDKALAVRIEEAQEKDDPMGHRKLAALLSTGKNRVKRVMRTYGLVARRTRQKDVYPGKAAEIAPNKRREEGRDLSDHEVVFSDLLDVKLSDGTRVRGCFALRHRTRQILGMAFAYHMRAERVMDAIPTLSFEVDDPIWHRDQGQPYGAAKTRELLLRKGFVLSMSRAGTPTDNGFAERVVGSFKLAVAERRPSPTLGQFLRAAEAWINLYNQERHHEGRENLSPLHYAQHHNVQAIPSLTLSECLFYRFSRTCRAQLLSNWFVKKRTNIYLQQEPFLAFPSLFFPRFSGDRSDLHRGKADDLCDLPDGAGPLPGLPAGFASSS